MEYIISIIIATFLNEFGYTLYSSNANYETFNNIFPNERKTSKKLSS
jgi:hypothetical protein